MFTCSHLDVATSFHQHDSWIWFLGQTAWEVVLRVTGLWCDVITVHVDCIKKIRYGFQSFIFHCQNKIKKSLSRIWKWGYGGRTVMSSERTEGKWWALALSYIITQVMCSGLLCHFSWGGIRYKTLWNSKSRVMLYVSPVRWMIPCWAKETAVSVSLIWMYHITTLTFKVVKIIFVIFVLQRGCIKLMKVTVKIFLMLQQVCILNKCFY